MPGVFDSKNFNAEVFAGYVGRIPNTKRNAMIQSRAIRMRPDLAQAMKDQTGGNYITTTLTGTISGTVPQNYDGETNMTPGSTVTFKHSRVVVGRMAGWTENDFAKDVTGGQDFMENIAQQISEYWSEVDQDTLLHILKGVFSMSTGAENQAFVTSHTSDVTAVVNSEGKTGHMDATTLNTAIQKACGDNKSAFSLAIMHSVVATNLENLKLLNYLKYNDGNGLEREIGLATLNGRIVLVDDAMPVDTTSPESPVYTTYALGDGATRWIVIPKRPVVRTSSMLVSASASPPTAFPSPRHPWPSCRPPMLSWRWVPTGSWSIPTLIPASSTSTTS